MEGKPFRHFIIGHIPSLAFELSLVEESEQQLQTCQNTLGFLVCFNLLECWQARAGSPKRNAFGCVQLSSALASCFRLTGEFGDDPN